MRELVDTHGSLLNCKDLRSKRNIIREFKRGKEICTIARASFENRPKQTTEYSVWSSLVAAIVIEGLMGQVLRFAFLSAETVFFYFFAVTVGFILLLCSAEEAKAFCRVVLF